MRSECPPCDDRPCEALQKRDRFRGVYTIIVTVNANAVKLDNATSSLVRFESKQISPFKKRSSLQQLPTTTPAF
jgi:hypothetical protein